MQSRDIQKRVYKEIKEINSEFLNLRTVISPDPANDISKFYFVMLPNDGAMAHLPLIGCMYIPQDYPSSPPVIHLYTQTGRYNVDVYRCYLRDKTHSTLCFDVLRSKPHGGIWTPELTLSVLFASLMSALVSFYVPQEYGGDQAEYVTMERLAQVKAYVNRELQNSKLVRPVIPKVPLVEAKQISAIPMTFPSEIRTAGNQPKTVTFGPIYLQTGKDQAYSFAADLSQLHAGVVFSVVLSNNPKDLVGKKGETILVRNGVTATAARKRAFEKTIWFYHGKPMNDGDMRVGVTVGHDQMTFTYVTDGKKIVHGDCAVSRLTPTQIGDVAEMPFYVSIFLKKKSGPDIAIKMLDTFGKGYIHDVFANVEADLPVVDDFELAEVVDADQLADCVDSVQTTNSASQENIEKETDDLPETHNKSWVDVLLRR